MPCFLFRIIMTWSSEKVRSVAKTCASSSGDKRIPSCGIWISTPPDFGDWYSSQVIIFKITRRKFPSDEYRERLFSAVSACSCYRKIPYPRVSGPFTKVGIVNMSFLETERRAGAFTLVMNTHNPVTPVISYVT